MLVIGLTGGIACGKSTVAELFRAKQIPVIDADQIAQDLVAKGQPALEAIHAHFGDRVLTPSGELDRAYLKQTIFDDPKAKQWLEAYLHPQIRERIRTKVSQLTTPYCVVEIPLLFESPPNPLLDRVCVVDCDLSLQKKRLLTRDDIDEGLMKKMLRSQVSQQHRRQHADDLIDNNGSESCLSEQVDKLHEQYSSIGVK